MSRPPSVTDRMMLEHLVSTWDKCTVYKEIVVTEPFKTLLAEGRTSPIAIRWRLLKLRERGYVQSRGLKSGVIYRITPKGEAYLERLVDTESDSG